MPLRHPSSPHTTASTAVSYCNIEGAMPTTNSLLPSVSRATFSNSNSNMIKKEREKNTMVHGPMGWVLEGDTLNDCFVFKVPCTLLFFSSPIFGLLWPLHMPRVLFFCPVRKMHTAGPPPSVPEQNTDKHESRTVKKCAHESPFFAIICHQKLFFVDLKIPVCRPAP